MKKTDFIGIGFVVLFALLVAFCPFDYGITGNALLKGDTGTFHWTGFVWNKLGNFGRVTAEFPYIMGFLKFPSLFQTKPVQ